MTVSTRLFSFCTLLLAVGCTGDSSDSGDTSDPSDTSDTDATDTDPADTTPPTVVSSTPFDGELDVALNRSVHVLFDEALDPSTVTSDSFTVTAGGKPVEGTVSYEGDTATFTPAADLAVTSLFEAQVTTAVTDLAGNHLDRSHVWTFASGLLADIERPELLGTNPEDAETDVTVTRTVNAYFNEPIDPTTIDETTFTVRAGVETVVGTFSVHGATVTFDPFVELLGDTVYEATISGAVADLTGNMLTTPHAWTFTTSVTETPGVGVNLRSAGNFAILAKSAISTVPPSVVTGDIGVSPAAATFITGFSLTADATNVFATSPQVVGGVYAADYAPPTPSNLTTAVGDMEYAFSDAAGRAPDFTELGAGDIGGMTLDPGVYKWGTSVLIPTDVTLDGSPTDVWIFQIAQNLTMSSATNVYLTGGALPKNVFWQVAGLVEVGTTAHLEGVVLTQTSATLRTGASINGRLLAQTAVVLDSSTVVEPAP